MNVWVKYGKYCLIKSNFYLRIYDSINKLNGEHVIIKEYDKNVFLYKQFEFAKFYKLLNSITLLEIIEKKKTISI